MHRTQAGQAVILLTLMLTALLAGVGAAIDGGAGYYYNTAAERAAAAAALSGVIFMPNQFSSAQAIPSGSGNDASDCAVAEARRNGFDVADTANNVQVVPAPVPGQSNQLQVTVSRTVPTLFMNVFGIQTYTVRRTAIAKYVAPISLGQPGNQVGSVVSQLGTSAYYTMIIEGWGVDRENGDPFTPDPAYEYSTTWGCPWQCLGLYPPSSDVHRYSAVTGAESSDATLPDRGGYNYRISLPSGGRIWVYNAAHDPDEYELFGIGTPNHCDNFRPGSPQYQCSPPNSNYFMREGLFVNPYNLTNFSTLQYTVFQVNNLFIRNTDQKLSQVKVRPIDARDWNLPSNQYRNVNTGALITQQWNPDGSPANMSIYHNWIDVTSYAGTGDAGLVSYTPGYGPLSGALAAGTYRLRVDALNFDGSNPSGTPPNRAASTHMYGVKATDAAGNPCTDCTISAWDDMAIYTPITSSSFTMPIFQIPPEYAGLTVSLDIFDPGDITGVGDVTISVINPATGAVASSPQGISIYDLGEDRSTQPSVGNQVSAPGNTVASFAATISGYKPYNGHWVHVDLPVPSDYSPGSNPNGWWWSLKYQTGTGTVATDVITVAVGLKGNPAHLVQS